MHLCACFAREDICVMLCKPLNKTMNNLRLWGYDRYQMQDTQQSRVANAGLIEKFNQLKTNIQEVQEEARQALYKHRKQSLR